MDRSLENSIIKTISYFDLFDFPLTSFEIHKNLLQTEKKYSLNRILQILNKVESIESKDGFYFLKNRSSIIVKRKQRYLLAENKIKKSKWLFSLLAKIPFVNAIYICNDLSYQNAPRESDIDLAIITEENRIWTARFFCTFLMKILNKRPSQKNKKDKICLSFFISENNLNLQKYSHRTYSQDIHYLYWLSQFVLIYKKNEKNINQFFWQENSWISDFLPNWYPFKTNSRWIIHCSYSWI